MISGAVNNLISGNYFNEILEWFVKFNVVMNANDMDFQQKDLKTIISHDTTDKKEIRKKFFESDSVKEIMGFAEFGNQEIGFVAEPDMDDLSMCSMYRIPLEKDDLMESPIYISMIVDSDLMESKGTIHLIRLLQPFIDALENGGEYASFLLPLQYEHGQRTGTGFIGSGNGGFSFSYGRGVF